MKSRVAWQRGVPETLRSLGGLANPDYLDQFTVMTGGATERSAEAWARAVLDGAPAYLRAAIFVVQRLLLGMRLGSPGSPDHILGWRIARRGDNWVRLEATSWLMTASLVFAVADGRLALATFVHYDRRITAIVWPPASRLHRRAGIALMRSAVSTRR